MSTPIKAIIIDGDDTLWECSRYYKEAMQGFNELAAKHTGLPLEFCNEMFQVIDGLSVTLPDGFTRERFPDVFRASYMALAAIADTEESILRIADEAYNIGDRVYYAEYPLYPGVKELLRMLGRTHTKIILNTKGDDEVQMRKIKMNGVEEYFDDIYITLVKDADHFQKILDTHDLDPKEVLSVGDSMRDDIILPQSLGVWTVWISDHSPEMFKPSWVYEKNVGVDNPQPNWWTPSVANLLNALGTHQDKQLFTFEVDLVQTSVPDSLVTACGTTVRTPRGY